MRRLAANKTMMKTTSKTTYNSMTNNLRNTRKPSQMENFSTTNIFNEKIGNIAMFMIDFIRAYCCDLFVIEENMTIL